jgi:hypothetical protein
VTLQQQAGVAVAEVLPVQTGTGTFQLHSLDEFIDKCQVGIPLQSRLPQAWQLSAWQTFSTLRPGGVVRKSW